MASPQIKSDSRFPLLALVVALIWIFWAAVGICVMDVSSRTKTESTPSPMELMGQFGDMFGVLTCFMTGIALCCAIYAARLQNRQLQDQKDQFRQERAYVHELLLREKLELLLNKLADFRTQSYAQAHLTDAERGLHPMDASLKILLPMYAAAEMLARLYFPRHLHELLPMLDMELAKVVAEKERKRSNIFPTEKEKTAARQLTKKLGSEAQVGISWAVKYSADVVRVYPWPSGGEKELTDEELVL